VRITPKTFFEHYIIDPFSYELNSEERIFALFLSIVVLPLTLGIAHLIAVAITKWNFHRCKANLIPEFHDNFQKLVTKTDQVASKILKCDSSSRKAIDNKNVPNFVQQIINERYSQMLPLRSEVTVPFRDGETWDKIKWIKWENLSQKEKLEVNNHFAHPHGQIWNNIIGEAIIDLAFFGWGQASYIPKDPKEHHGSDHSVRTALFATAFAYLYHKYHPGYEVTLQDVAFAAVIGAGHDSGRQTEVADVYDEKSAEITCDFLKKWGITDEDTLKTAHDAIANKDNNKLDSKPLIAKCVQNADSAEFARLNVLSPAFPKQSDAAFEYSRGFLDIYKELKELSEKGNKLKNGFSFEDFVFELDSLRKEMNTLIYQTHKKSTRLKLSESENYFNGITRKINRVQYPLLNDILTKVEMISSVENKKSYPINVGYTSFMKEEFNKPEGEDFYLDNLLQQLEEDKPLFLLGGSDSVRKRRVRLCKKTINEKKIIEVSFELTKSARKKLNKKLALLEGDSEVTVSSVPSISPKKDLIDGKYYTTKDGERIEETLGNDKKISFEGVDIFVGEDRSLWNQYHLVRIIMDESTSKERYQKALSKIELSSALLPSRKEDALKDALARTIAFRYPSAVYTVEGKQIDAKEAYESLDDEKKQQINKDIEAIQLRNIESKFTELVNPQLPKEAWKAGASAFCAFSSSGTIKETAKTMVNILRTGYLSNQERSQRGIGRLTFTSRWNNKQGSANQVFTRILPKSWFEQQLSLDRFAVRGPIMVLFDLKAFEKMPYSYDKDQGGVRNPEFYLPVYAVLTTNQPPELLFNGAEKKAGRRPFPENITHIARTEAIQNEFMFDTSLGPEYIKKLVVHSEVDKYVLLNQLEKQGIFDINGVSLGEAIIVSNHLYPSMVKDFETYNSSL
jgi:hypothetical protein